MKNILLNILIVILGLCCVSALAVIAIQCIQQCPWHPIQILIGGALFALVMGLWWIGRKITIQ